MSGPLTGVRVVEAATVFAGRRVMRVVDRDDLADAPWFGEMAGRLASVISRPPE